MMTSPIRPPRIKVCCVGSVDEARMAIAAGADAIDQVRPWGVDLCSGVRSGGKLDANKLKPFMRAVRG